MAQPKQRSSCPVSYFLDFLGDKWTLLILRDIILRKKRHFKDMLSSEEHIATNILADRLNKLERGGFVTKTKDEKKKTQWVYEATKKGVDLMPILLEIAKWSFKYDPEIDVDRLGMTKEEQKNPDEFIEKMLSQALASS